MSGNRELRENRTPHHSPPNARRRTLLEIATHLQASLHGLIAPRHDALAA